MIPEPTKVQEPIRFGEDFEFDVFNRRLRRGSHALKVERIPLEILTLLVERQGRAMRSSRGFGAKARFSIPTMASGVPFARFARS